MSMLVLQGVEKRFGGLSVLTGIDLDVREGERHAIIGPNGAGKSTLFNLISGRLRPSAGRILFRGRDIAGLSAHRIARLGIARAFQIINVFPRLSVFENLQGAALARAGHCFDVLSHADRLAPVNAAVSSVMERVGLAHRRDAAAQTLAYGEQRRLELALSLAQDPALMLLDEPCAGLNAEDTRAAIALIRRVTEGRTLIMVEHDMNVVFGLADRVSVIHYGKVLATGTPAQIRADERVQQAYLGRRSSVAAS